MGGRAVLASAIRRSIEDGRALKIAGRCGLRGCTTRIGDRGLVSTALGRWMTRRGADVPTAR